MRETNEDHRSGYPYHAINIQQEKRIEEEEEETKVNQTLPMLLRTEKNQRTPAVIRKNNSHQIMSVPFPVQAEIKPTVRLVDPF